MKTRRFCPAMGLLLAATMFSGGCGAPDRHSGVDVWPEGDTSYDFDRPDANLELPAVLEEISGVVVLEDGMLATVQDEDGIIYTVEPATGSIVEERTFGPPGDYEAVALAASSLYVLESDGTLYRIDDWTGEELAAVELELDLPSRCDAEGLRYDGGRLLVLCKEDGGPDVGQDKAVFEFDLDGHGLSERPAYRLDPRAFSVSVEDHPVNEAVRRVLSERVDLSGFKPSELAVHPITDEIFVLSSVREAVLAMDRDGTVTGVWKLPDEYLDQPEGMDFLPNGDLFIASEAADRSRAALVRFNYRSSQQATTP